MSNTQRDGNISFSVEGMVAHVRMNGTTELFSSTNWEKAEERYQEALMLRDQSGFKDAATIRQHLERIEEQYG